MHDGGSGGPIVAGWDEPQAAGHLDGDGCDVDRDGERVTRRWPARWLRPGRLAWATFLTIWGGLVLVGAPIGLAMLPAAVCAGVNLALLRMDERLLRPRVPDTVPAGWSGIDSGTDTGEDPAARGDDDR